MDGRRRSITFAGHPSIGAAVSVALAHRLDAADFVQETSSGLQPLHVVIADDRLGGRATLRQNALVLGAIIDPTPILHAFGLGADDAHPDLPAQLVSTGLESLVLPVRDIAALGRVRMDPVAVRPALAAIGEPDRLTCYFVAEVDATTWAGPQPRPRPRRLGGSGHGVRRGPVRGLVGRPGRPIQAHRAARGGDG